MTRRAVPRALLTEVGDVVVSFSLLEHALEGLTGSLIAEDPGTARVVTARLDFRSLRVLAASLYLERHGRNADFAGFRELMVRCGALERQRSQLVHSLWEAGQEPDSMARRRDVARGRTRRSSVPETLTLEDLRRLAADIRETHEGLQRLQVDVNDTGK